MNDALHCQVVSHSRGSENLTNLSDKTQQPKPQPSDRDNTLESSVDAAVIPAHVELTDTSIDSFKATLPTFSSEYTAPEASSS